MTIMTIKHEFPLNWNMLLFDLFVNLRGCLDHLRRVCHTERIRFLPWTPVPIMFLSFEFRTPLGTFILFITGLQSSWTNNWCRERVSSYHKALAHTWPCNVLHRAVSFVSNCFWFCGYFVVEELCYRSNCDNISDTASSNTPFWLVQSKFLWQINIRYSKFFEDLFESLSVLLFCLSSYYSVIQGKTVSLIRGKFAFLGGWTGE